ncbi:MAG: hypothetical protein M1835_002544 [Candelina submexicana]|nr:MAG: hypothetical protein M1835_002544 [Candelina submexicana]
MSKENSPPASPPSSSYSRRASISPGQPFYDMFGRPSTNSGAANSTSPYPGPISVAAANAQAAQRQRRMSLSTLGLSGSSPTQPSPFGTGRSRRDSISSSTSGSTGNDESAIEEGDAVTSPITPFGRRMSFGARALRDVRAGNGNANGRASTLASSPTTKGRGLSSFTSTKPPLGSTSDNEMRHSGEGFNWSEALRSRAERTSISFPPNTNPPPSQSYHQRAETVTTMEQPAKEMPKASKAPDHFQERILKGDFYMD